MMRIRIHHFVDRELRGIGQTRKAHRTEPRKG